MTRAQRSIAIAASLGALTAWVATAPAAQAAITGITVAQGVSFGGPQQFGTGCNYVVTATAAAGEYVSFYDSQQGSFDPPGAILVGSSGTVTATWTPSTRGNHNLHAVQIGSEQSTRVEVGNGTKLGFGCLVRP